MPSPDNDSLVTQDVVAPSSLEDYHSGQLHLDVVKAAGYVKTYIDDIDNKPPAWIESINNPRDHIQSLELSKSLYEEDMPETGQPIDKLLHTMFDGALEGGMNHTSPGFCGFVGCGGLPESGIADLAMSTVNRYLSVWMAAPGLATLEANVLRWLCALLGFKKTETTTPYGVFTPGGSIANLTGLVAARRTKLSDNAVAQGIIYVSDQTHHCVMKAAIMAGFPESSVRKVRSDDKNRVLVEEMRKEIQKDRKAGLVPFMIVGNAGTTNTGAVDSLSSLADLAKEEGNLWFHVDACYGGFFLLTDRGKTLMNGIERADSVSLDPHKSLFLPHGCGVLLVNDSWGLKKAMTPDAIAAYMPAPIDDQYIVDSFTMSFELTRSARGLRVWLPLKLHGADAFRTYLDEKMDLARRTCQQVSEIEGIEITARPELSIFAFRHHNDSLSLDEVNAINARLIAKINSKRTVFLSPTKVDGKFMLRIAIMNFRTHQATLDKAVLDIAASLQEVLSE